MNRKIALLIGCLILACGLLISTWSSAAEKKPSTNDQLDEILSSQKDIEKRLSLIEAKQAGIIYLLQAMTAGGMPSRAQAGTPPEENKVYSIEDRKSVV